VGIPLLAALTTPLLLPTTGSPTHRWSSLDEPLAAPHCPQAIPQAPLFHVIFSPFSPIPYFSRAAQAAPRNPGTSPTLAGTLITPAKPNEIRCPLNKVQERTHKVDQEVVGHTNQIRILRCYVWHSTVMCTMTQGFPLVPTTNDMLARCRPRLLVHALPCLPASCLCPSSTGTPQ